MLQIQKLRQEVKEYVLKTDLALSAREYKEPKEFLKKLQTLKGQFKKTEIMEAAISGQKAIGDRLISQKMAELRTSQIRMDLLTLEK